MPHPSLKRPALAGIIALASATPATATVIGFEDVGLPTAYPGPGGGGYYNGSDGAGGFVSDGLAFPNEFTDFGGGFSAWRGFSVSSTTDIATPGIGNQYSAFTGGAFAGSQYAVVSAFDPLVLPFGGPVDLGGSGGFHATNTTYAGLSMLDGDPFAKKFGGASGDDEDFLLLTIEGILEGEVVGQVAFYLADYRFADNSRDYVIDRWEWVDLTSLGTVDALGFSLSSSDTGNFGMNTPAYFAMDHLTIPEPGVATLLALSLGGVLTRRRRTIP